jgi:hypothetical protein
MGTYKRFIKLIERGPKVFGRRTGTYYHLNDTNEYNGGRIAKLHDVHIHNQTVEQSKYKRGKGWQMGVN